MANEKFLELVGVEPDRNGLLQWLVDEVIAADVESLARADSEFNWQDNLLALQQIMAQREVRDPIDVGESWLQEVCSLTMWGDAAARDTSEHRQVALACTIQILAAMPGEPWEEYVHSMSDPVAALVVSVRALGPEAVHHALRLLAEGCVRFAGNDYDEPEDLFCGLGMLVLLARAPDEAWQYLHDLEERQFARDMGSNSKQWLWRLTFFDGSRALWRELLLAAAERADESAARDAVIAHVRIWRGK